MRLCHITWFYQKLFCTYIYIYICTYLSYYFIYLNRTLIGIHLRKHIRAPSYTHRYDHTRTKIHMYKYVCLCSIWGDAMPEASEDIEDFALLTFSSWNGSRPKGPHSPTKREHDKHLAKLGRFLHSEPRLTWRADVEKSRIGESDPTKNGYCLYKIM